MSDILTLLFAFLVASALIVPSLCALTSTKRNWCNIVAEPEWSEKADAGEIARVLSGMHLQMGVLSYPPYAMRNNETGEWEGFDIELFKLVAERGQFSFNITELRHPQGEDETYNSILYGQGREFDVLVTWWDETSARKKHGIGFSIPVVDMSFQLVTTNPQPRSPPFSNMNIFFLFLKPFSRDVWLVLLFSNVFTGIFMYVLEPSLSEAAESHSRRTKSGELAPAKSWRRHAFGVIDLFHHGWMAWTLGRPIWPRKWYTKLYMMSWSGIILVMVAIYTSQLTAFLFVELQSTVSINSLDDLIASRKPVCAVTAEGAVQRFLKLDAPSVPVYSIPNLYAAFPSIREGKCAAALMRDADIEVELSRNQACDMHAVGKSLNSLSAGYAADSNDCGLKPLFVFDAILQELQESGEIENLWSRYTELPPECVGKLTGDPKNTNTIITVTQIGGLFILHAAIAFVSLCGFAASWGKAKLKLLGKSSGALPAPEEPLELPKEGPAPKLPGHSVILIVYPKKESADSST